VKGGIRIMRSLVPKNKTGGVVSSTIMGVGGLLIGVIIILVITSTLLNANLLTAGSPEDNASQDLNRNFTGGINKVSEKIPTILLIVAVVFLFSALVLLMRNAKAMGIGEGGSL
jgi:hypothetical protein